MIVHDNEPIVESGYIILFGWFDNESIYNLLSKFLDEKDCKQVNQLLNFKTEFKDVLFLYNFNQYPYEDHLIVNEKGTYDIKYGPYYKIRYLQKYVDKINWKKMVNLKINFHRSCNSVKYLLYFGDHMGKYNFGMLNLEKIHNWEGQFKRLSAGRNSEFENIQPVIQSFRCERDLSFLKNIKSKNTPCLKDQTIPCETEHDTKLDIDELEDCPDIYDELLDGDGDVDEEESKYDWGDKHPMKELD